MLTNEIIRAWKDRDYRDSLNQEQRALLPDNPAGMALNDDELENVGGAGTETVATCVLVLCPITTFTITTE